MLTEIKVIVLIGLRAQKGFKIKAKGIAEIVKDELVVNPGGIQEDEIIVILAIDNSKEETNNITVTIFNISEMSWNQWIKTVIQSRIGEGSKVQILRCSTL